MKNKIGKFLTLPSCGLCEILPPLLGRLRGREEKDIPAITGAKIIL